MLTKLRPVGEERFSLYGLNRLSKTHIAFGYLFVAILILFSCFIRFSDFQKTTGARNLEATYHVLSTVNALNANSISDSKLLPIVTLGNEKDKFISWGATVPMANGNYVYTSFSPAGFIVPFLFFKTAGITPSLKGIIFFNVILGLLSGLALFHLLIRLVAASGVTGLRAIFCAIAGASCLVFSREGLVSFGLVYWSHSLQQFFLILQLISFLSLANYGMRRHVNSYGLLGLALLSFFTAYIEWSGIVGNFFLCLLAAFYGKGYKNEANQKLIVAVSAGTVVAMAAFMGHLAYALGFKASIHALLARFIGRSTVSKDGSLVSLMEGYMLSYGMIIFLLIVMLIWFFLFSKNKNSEPEHAKSIAIFALLAACAPLLENIIMLQHAVQFSFDRLKFSVPVAIVIAATLAQMLRNSKWVAGFSLGLLGLSLVQNIRTYNVDNLRFANWRTYDEQNKLLKNAIVSQVDLSCSVLGTNSSVRGYANFLFGRSIYEFTSASELQARAVQMNACAAIWIEQQMPYPDLPSFRQAAILRPGHLPIIVQADASTSNAQVGSVSK